MDFWVTRDKHLEIWAESNLEEEEWNWTNQPA